jgi:DNA gyrase/topoisomerase IV subunit B
LVEDGRVYAALSPLYHVDQRKKSWRYFINREDFIRYVRDAFFKNHILLHASKKKPFTKAELSSLIINNNNYDTMLETIGGNYAIYPILLEDMLLLRNSSFQVIKKKIEEKYNGYLHVRQDKGQIIVDGLANDMSHLFAFNQNLINACAPILPYIDRSEKRYILDGKKLGLYEVIKAYRESEPKNIERAKGLGSLNAYEIGYSTLSPERRTLIRYTVKDIEDEIEEIRKINDDQYQLIKDIDISQYEF